MVQNADGIIAGKSVVVLYNPSSGERVAASFVQQQLEELLTPGHLFNLFPVPRSPPAVEAAKAFLTTQRPDMIIVAGGDGTVSLVMDIVDALREDGTLAMEEAPIAVLPMGTGNDLSRSLGFGGGYLKPRSGAPAHLKKLLTKLVTNAQPQKVDRWNLTVSLTPFDDKTSDIHQVFMNYFSVGFDAAVTCRFGSFREKNPQLCSSRTMCKAWYGYMACGALVREPTLDHKRIRLRVDGNDVALPSDCKAIVVCNMLTYASGLKMWKDSHLRYETPAVDDGLLEVLSLSGVWHLVGIGTKTRAATKLAQGGEVELITPAHYYMQYDGEPIRPCGKSDVDVVIRIQRAMQSLATVMPEGQALLPLSSSEEQLPV